MGKSERADIMQQVYREFSRQKYNKYKHQFPKMRESQIVSKIMREWDSLGPDSKEKLRKLYLNNKFINRKGEPSEPDTPQHHSRPSLDSPCPPSQEHPTAVKSEPKEEREEARKLCTPSSSRKSLEANSEKSKRNSSLKGEYITFYKYYFAKYRVQHQKWTTKQISKVISLLWTKRKNQYKRVNVKKNKAVPRYQITGRKLFKKIKKLDKDQLKTKWKQLPRESKMIWSQPDKQSQLRQGKMVFRCGQQREETNSLAFLSKVME